MTVGRTEKPAAPEGWSPPRKTWTEDANKGIGSDGAAHGKSNKAAKTTISVSPPVGEMSAQQTEGGKSSQADDNPAPIKRHKIGAGSYEDPTDARKASKRKSKTGKPGK